MWQQLHGLRWDFCLRMRFLGFFQGPQGSSCMSGMWGSCCHTSVSAEHARPPLAHEAALRLGRCMRAGDKQGGCVRVLYDATLSTRGVLLAAGRKPRAKDPFDFEVRLLTVQPP